MPHLRRRTTALLAAALLSLAVVGCSDGELDDAGVGPGAEEDVDLGDPEMGDPATDDSGIGDPADPGSEVEDADG
jgi:hypothetical protein